LVLLGLILNTWEKLALCRYVLVLSLSVKAGSTSAEPLPLVTIKCWGRVSKSLI